MLPWLSPLATAGAYEVIGPLGAGGMGEVYRARDPKLGRDVALKVLPDGKFLVMTRSGALSDLLVLPADGAGMAGSGRQMAGLRRRWGPDGRVVLFDMPFMAGLSRGPRTRQECGYFTV